MSTHMFRCARCGQSHDLPVRAGAEIPEVLSCPFCGAHEARRRYVAPTVIYKAAGFTGAGAKPRQDVQRK